MVVRVAHGGLELITGRERVVAGAYETGLECADVVAADVWGAGEAR